MSKATRRQFLNHGAATALTAPLFVSHLLSQPPNRRVRHACVGGGGMGASDMGSISSHKDVQIVCVAEIDTSRHAGVRKRFPAGNVNVYQDWRAMLDKEAKNLDSLNVS